MGSNRVIRGGVWSDLARACRSADRDDLIPVIRLSDFGFRVVLAPRQP
jgi:formylglycine-generating enzyme required for sulfatase activity